jgi:glycerate 2-kinase
MNPDGFFTKSIRKTPEAMQVTSVLQAAMEAVDPVEAIRQSLRLSSEQLAVSNKVYDLREYRRVFVIGFGKASGAMAEAVGAILDERISAGVVIAKYIDAGQLKRIHPRIELLQGDHPVPGEGSLQATQRLLELLDDVTEHDLVICLISGGGSALFTQPQANLTLQEIQDLTHSLLVSGAEIGEINALRKHLDQVKGGGLARLAAPAAMITLIISDVIGSPLDVIASGPTAPDPSTYDEGLRVLRKYNLLDSVPEQILRVLRDGEAGKLPETVKEGDPILDRVHNVLIADNYRAAQAAIAHARSLGWNVILLTTYLHGEAQQAGMMLGGILRQVANSGEPCARPALIVAGGETTVTVRGAGRGGRNQELALGAVRELAGLDGVMLVTLATDGDDGPTDAAGAVVTGETLTRGRQHGLIPDLFLENNDSYHYFHPLEDLLMTGPSGTNVNDLTFLFAF